MDARSKAVADRVLRMSGLVSTIDDVYGNICRPHGARTQRTRNFISSGPCFWEKWYNFASENHPRVCLADLVNCGNDPAKRP